MVTVAEFNTEWSKSIVESFDNQSKEAITNTAMNRIFDITDTTEYTESYNSTEAMELPGYLDESENLKTSKLGKGYKVTFDSREFGHKIKVTKKSRLKTGDSTEKLNAVVNREKNGAIIAMNSFLEIQTHKLLNEAFSSTTYLSPDGKSLCADDHTWNSTGATFDNKLSTGTALSADIVDAVEKYAGAFTDAQGTAMPLNFRNIIVKKGGTAATAAKRLFGTPNSNGQYSPTTIGNINIYEGTYTIVETPWMTSDTAYFFIADMEGTGIENPMFVNFIERPAIQGGFVQDEDNLDWIMPVAGSFKFGIRDLPFTVLGDPGA